ncbi:MAG: hypothetical protein DWH79_03420 [Planctomycetota bacterium]|nr:MAG: hypothetical protein DWH79_03420 [Planctomycetota bacterium]
MVSLPPIPHAPQPRSQQQAQRLIGQTWIDGEDTEERVEPFCGGVGRVDEDMATTAEITRPAGEVAERFLANTVPEFAGQLDCLFEEAEGL